MQRILVNGEEDGCCPLCVRRTLACFEEYGSPLSMCSLRGIQEIGGTLCPLLIIVPGGDVWPDSDDSSDDENFYGQYNALGSGVDTIDSWIENGCIYLGICAGAFLAMALSGTTGKVWTVNTLNYGLTCIGNSKMVNVIRVPGISNKWNVVMSLCERQPLYYEDGPLIDASREADQILAVYDCPECEDMHGKGAIACVKYGKGMIVLISPHPELTPGCEQILPLLACISSQ